MQIKKGMKVGVSQMNPFRVQRGPFTVTDIDNGEYFLSNGDGYLKKELVPWTDDMEIGKFIPGFQPQMAPTGRFEVGQKVKLRGYGSSEFIISGGPYLHNGQVVYEVMLGMMLVQEKDLNAIAAPKDIYSAIPSVGEKALPTDAENAILFTAIEPGTEMVNFHGEFDHGRFYSAKSFKDLPMKTFPQIGKFKENPYTRSPIKPTNVTRYKSKGGRRKHRTLRNRR